MPQFWQPCTLDANTVEQLDFQLLRADNDSHTMLVATDMHLANRNTPKDYVQFADGFVKELTSAYNSAAPGKYTASIWATSRGISTGTTPSGRCPNASRASRTSTSRCGR